MCCESRNCLVRLSFLRARRERHFSLFGPGMVVVETKIGAASLIALQGAGGAAADDPRTLRVQLPQARGAYAMTCKPISI